MNLDALAKRFVPKEQLDRDPALADGKYTLAVEEVQTSKGHKGEFTHVRFRVQQAEAIDYTDERLLFEDESSFPKPNPENSIAKVSFKTTDEKQVEKLFELIMQIDPAFKEEKNRSKILAKIDSAEQPYKGVLIKAKCTRAIAKVSQKAYRARRFENMGATPEETRAMRAELENTPAK